MTEIRITMTGLEQLERKLQRLNNIRFDGVVKKQLTQMLNRARTPGGTPFDSGELRKSSCISGDRVGYMAEYAPHVEYGHRTINGGWIPGQKYLQNNVSQQKPIYEQDLKDAIRKG